MHEQMTDPEQVSVPDPDAPGLNDTGSPLGASMLLASFALAARAAGPPPQLQGIQPCEG